MLARTKQSFSTGYVMFYWTLGCLISHFFLFVYSGWPQAVPSAVLGWVSLAGLLAAGAQFLTARAYQRSPSATRVAMVLYAAPLLSLFLEVCFFEQSFGVLQAVGLAAVLGAASFELSRKTE
jgi:drug/metabolite transporter (DMT)-like permease